MIPYGTFSHIISRIIPAIYLINFSIVTTMKKNQGFFWVFLSLFGLGIHSAQAQLDEGLVVHELSLGPSGQEQQYIELLVVGCPNSNLDIQGWIVDDNNGDFSDASPVGLSQGHIRFASNAQWANMPVGALIVLYNPQDRNPNLPADDPTDANGDLVYVLPINSSLLEVCSTSPSLGNSAYSGCTPAVPTAGDWAVLELDSAQDAIQTREPGGTYFHGFAYGNTISGNNAGITDGLLLASSGDGNIFSFNPALPIANQPYRLASNFAVSLAASSGGSAGLPNGSNDAAYILGLQNGDAVADAGADDIVESCFPLSQVVNVSGSGTLDPSNSGWTWISNPAIQMAPVINSPTQPNTSITLNEYGIYQFVWQACANNLDTVTITYENAAAIAEDTIQNFCNVAQSIAASGNLSGSWQVISYVDTFGVVNNNPDPGVFNFEFQPNENQRTPIFEIDEDNLGTYTLIWQVNNPGGAGVCTDTLRVIFERIETISTDNAVACGNEANLSADTTYLSRAPDIGQWEIFSQNPESVGLIDLNTDFEFVFVDGISDDRVSRSTPQNNPRAVLRYIPVDFPPGVNEFSIILNWTLCPGGNASALQSRTARVDFFRPPVANIQVPDSVAFVCGSSISLDADILADETGTWSQSPFSLGNGVVTFTPDPAAPADPTRTIATAPDFGTYTIYWEVNNDDATIPCTDIDSVVVTFYEPPVSNAGVDSLNICGLSSSLDGSALQTSGNPAFFGMDTNPNQVGRWIQISGPGQATFADSTNNQTDVTVDSAGTYVFQWDVFYLHPPSNPQEICLSSDRVTYKFVVPNADAGMDQEVVCGPSAVLSGNNPVNPEVGFWEIVNVPVGASAGDVVFTDASSPNTSVTIQFVDTTGSTQDGETYTFRWVIQEGICSDTSEVQVTFFDIPNPDAGPDSSGLCDLNNYSLMASAPASAQIGFWQTQSGPGLVSFNDPSDPNTQISVSTPGTYVLSWNVGILRSLGDTVCTVNDEVVLEFVVPPIPDAGPDQEDICFLDSNSSNLQASPSSGPLGTGEWTALDAGSTVQTPSSPTSVVTVNTIGEYRFVWTIEGGTSCEAQDTVLLRFTSDTISVNLEPIGRDTICGLSTTLRDTNGFPLGTWTSSPAGVIFSNPTGAETEVTIPINLAYTQITFTRTIGQGSCGDSESQSVIFVPPLPEFPNRTVNLFQGKSIQVDVSEGLDVPDGAIYRWIPDSTLDNPNVANPTLSPFDDELYTVTVTTGTGEAACNRTFQVEVRVFTELTIPNVFTPNGDQVNDVWEIPLLEQFTDAEVKVFNRWGNTVYESTGYDEPWNGLNDNGKMVSFSTYYYSIRLDNGQEYSGSVVVLR